MKSGTPLRSFLITSLVATWALFGLNTSAWAATSPGKIGPWVTVEADQRDGQLSDFLRVCPAAALWELRSNTPPKTLDSFATACADSAIVLIPDTASLEKFPSTTAPESAANAAWNATLSFQNLTQYAPNRFWIQGPYQALLPSMNSSEGIAWQRAFWRTFGELTGNSGAALLIPTGEMTADGLQAIAEEVRQLRGKTGFSLSATTSEICIGDDSAALNFRGNLQSLKAIVPASTIFLAPAGFLGSATADDALAWFTWFDDVLRRHDVRAALVKEVPTAQITFDDAGTRLAAIPSATVHPESSWRVLEACTDDSGNTEADAGDDIDTPSDGGSPSSPGGVPLGGPSKPSAELGCSAASSAAFFMHPFFLVGLWGACRRKRFR